jgi:predicted ribosomally synthesized peptide with SipW-like signal peptide
MKKIISSVGMIVFAAAIVAGGTGAFFSDTETSTGNVFTAGAIDLKVDSVAHINGLVCFNGEWVVESEVVWDPVDARLELVGDADVAAAETAYNLANPSNVPQAGDECAGTWALTDLEGEVAYQFFNYGDLKPGDNGENTISLHVDNNDAYMCATVDVTEDADNTLTEPESDVPDPDGLASGELDNELELIIWEDDGDNVLETPEVANILVETESANGIEGTYDLYTSLTGAIPASTTAYMGVYWCYGDLTRVDTVLTCDGAPVTNVSQTDSLKANLTFYVEQARHNEEFTCEEREVPTGPTTATGTVDKIVTFTSDTIVGVDVTDFVLTLDGPATGTADAVVVVDEIPTAGLTPGVYTISEVYSGVPAGVTFNAAFSGACSEIGDTGVGTMTLVAGDNAVCTITNSVSPAI